MSAGNDIVALKAVNITRSNHPKFYSRILSPAEKELYDELKSTSIPFWNFVWLFWSIKEAAFKFLQRNNPDLVFSPTKFIVAQLVIPAGYKINNVNSTQITGVGFDTYTINGILIYDSNSIFFRSSLTTEFVHSVVNNVDDFDSTYYGIKQIEGNDSENQSKAIRDFLIENLQKQTGFNHLAVSKNVSDIPIITKRNEELSIPVSLSHHDNWIAYSFQLG
jgi:phosphopantetheinyl transferase (holo-ACP synthase)